MYLVVLDEHKGSSNLFRSVYECVLLICGRVEDHSTERTSLSPKEGLNVNVDMADSGVYAFRDNSIPCIGASHTCAACGRLDGVGDLIAGK